MFSATEEKIENSFSTNPSSFPLDVLNDSTLHLKLGSAQPLPNHKCAFLTSRNEEGDLIVIYCLKTGKILSTISPINNKSSINAMTVIDSRFLVSLESCGDIFIRNLQQNDPQNNAKIIGNWKKEGLPGTAYKFIFLAETRELVSLHTSGYPKYLTQLAVWDIEKQQLSKKIVLEKDFCFAKVKFLMPNKVLAVTALTNANIKFYSIDLLTSETELLFEKSNVNAILEIDTSQQSIITWAEANDNTYKIIRRYLKDGLDKELFQSKSIYPFFPFSLFQKPARKDINSFAIIPEGYAISLENGEIHYYSEDSKPLHTIQLNTIKNYSKYKYVPASCITWNPYNGNIIYYDDNQVTIINGNYQIYQDVLDKSFNSDVINIIKGYIGFEQSKL